VKTPLRASLARSGLVLLTSAALLTAAAGCTDEDPPSADRSAARSSAPSSSAATTPTSTPVPDSVPLKVVVTRVSGKLPPASRPALEANVGRTVSAYVDAAFLGGDYPRSDFSGSFAAFTPGAANDARRDQGLLTNAAFGPSTESVRATRRTAYLSVLAPYKVAAGVTAKVDLVFVVDRGDRPAQRVRLAGRLLLTRGADDGQWAVFGYDLHRSVTPRSAS
jgi:hypothetical protein